MFLFPLLPVHMSSDELVLHIRCFLTTNYFSIEMFQVTLTTTITIKCDTSFVLLCTLTMHLLCFKFGVKSFVVVGWILNF